MAQADNVRRGTRTGERDGELVILRADNLRKLYGPRAALAGLTFSLKAGHILGLLGPNGAGKTTAIRILTTILEPDAGHFVIDGIASDTRQDPRANRCAPRESGIP